MWHQHPAPPGSRRLRRADRPTAPRFLDKRSRRFRSFDLTFSPYFHPAVLSAPSAPFPPSVITVCYAAFVSILHRIKRAKLAHEPTRPSPPLRSRRSSHRKLALGPRRVGSRSTSLAVIPTAGSAKAFSGRPVVQRLPLFQTTKVKATYVRTCLLLAACVLIPAPVARGDTLELPTEPILRLNPEAHTVPIDSISVDKHGRFIATRSIDQPVCVWDLETGRLEQVLRVPLGQGYVGEVYAVAISPDASRVAVSEGVTSDDSNVYSIYIFDRRSGRLQYRIKNLPQPSVSLTYSPDGRFLAATINLEGLRVYETSSYRTIGEDSDNSDLEWADFDTENRLAWISTEGNWPNVGAVCPLVKR